MKIATLTTVLIAVAALFLSAGVLRADTSTDSLKASFAKRLPALQSAKRSGKIGETATGFVAAVNGDGGSIVDEENADRKTLYGLIAKSENISVDQVGGRAAVRNFAKAAPGEWIQGKDGKWTQKK